ncbi:MAG: hypothetical protein U0Y68_20405 [Blastocatellia bacterium]
MKKRILTIVGLLTLTFAIGAQPVTNDTEADNAASAKREQKAKELLEQVLTEAQGLKLPENRVYVQMIAAEILWKKDEPRARALFQAAAETLAQIDYSAASNDQNENNRRAFAVQMRQQLLQTLAQLDAQLTLEILRATRPAHSLEQSPNAPDPEAQMEAQLAAQVSLKDPKRAAQMVEESLDKGLTYSTWDAIMQLQAKDPEAAQQLVSKVVTKIKSEDFVQNPLAASVASNILFSLNGQVVAPNAKRPALLNEQEQKEFLTAMIAAVMKAYETSAEGGAHQVMSTLQQTMPLVEKYAPTQALTLRRKFPPPPAVVGNNKVYEEFNQIQQKGTVEQLLAFAKTAPPHLSNEAYQQAAIKALNQGEAERARTIINTNAPASQRRWMLENLDQQQLWKAANADKLEEVRRVIDALPSGERKAAALMQMAGMLLAKGNKTVALQWLQEARQLLPAHVTTYNQMHSRLQFLNQLAGLDAEQSAEALAHIVPQLNTLLSAAETLDEFEQRHNFQNGEMRLQGGGGMLPQVLRQFAETLATVALSDVERANAINEQFEREEARLLVRLGLVQTTLRNAAEMGNGTGRRTGIIRPGMPPPPPPPRPRG